MRLAIVTVLAAVVAGCGGDRHSMLPAADGGADAGLDGSVAPEPLCESPTIGSPIVCAPGWFAACPTGEMAECNYGEFTTTIDPLCLDATTRNWSGSPVVCERYPGTTTCEVVAAPDPGDVTPPIAVTFSFRSNGSACTATVDVDDRAAPHFHDLTFGPVDCTTAGSAVGTTLPGTHTVTLHVGDGPGGPTTCSGTFTIEGDYCDPPCAVGERCAMYSCVPS